MNPRTCEIITAASPDAFFVLSQPSGLRIGSKIVIDLDSKRIQQIKRVDGRTKTCEVVDVIEPASLFPENHRYFPTELLDPDDLIEL